MPIAGGLLPALHFARYAGYDAVQVFPGNPKGWQYSPMQPAAATAVRAEAALLDLKPIAIHAPYIINIASVDDGLAERSERGLANSLSRAEEIGARYVIVHAGSHRGEGEEVGIARVARLVESVLAAAPAGVELLIENSAGSGNVLAGSPQALRRLLDALPPQVGACVDTAHLWGAGSDLSTCDGVERALDELDHAVGLARLRVLHVNDSAVGLGSKRDVHANLGEGHIGLPGLSAWMAHPALARHPMILETPVEAETEREATRCAIARFLCEGDIGAAEAMLATLHETDQKQAAKPRSGSGLVELSAVSESGSDDGATNPAGRLKRRKQHEGESGRKRDGRPGEVAERSVDHVD